MTLQELEILLSDQVQAQIERHLDQQPESIALQKHLPHARLVATQVKYLQRARRKLPEMYGARCIIPPLAFEQSSSEACAASRAMSGELCIDLTCGLGVDALALSRRFGRVVAVERDPVLAAVAVENFRRLGAGNIEVVCMSAEEFIDKAAGLRADLVFADPDRRNSQGRKQVLLQDCSPDISVLLPRLRAMAGCVAVKLSPMFDVAEAAAVFGPDVRICALSVDGECKEVTVLTGQGISGVTLSAVIPPSERADFSGMQSRQPDGVFDASRYRYLVVPDVSLQKIRCVGRCFEPLGIYFCSENGYGFSEHRPSSGMLKVFGIESIEPFNPGALKKALRREGIRGADIMCRQFPLSAAQIATQAGIRQGGSVKLCFTSAGGKLWQMRLNQEAGCQSAQQQPQ